MKKRKRFSEKLTLQKNLKAFLLAPVVVAKKGEYTKVFENLCKQGFIRARVDGKVCNDITGLSLFKTNKYITK